MSIKKKKKIQNKKYREKNPDKLKKLQKEWREKNPDKIKKRDKNYRNSKGGREKKKKYNYLYNKNNKPRINRRRRERERDRYKSDMLYRLVESLRGGLHQTLKAQGASKNARTIEYSCCSVKFLRNHLEKQFTDGMNWDNWSIDGWHIDHRRPRDSFNLNNEDEIYMCQHYTNLQPMWGPENMAKGNDYDPETFEYVWKGRAIGWRLKKFDVVFTKLKKEIGNY